MNGPSNGAISRNCLTKPHNVISLDWAMQMLLYILNTLFTFVFLLRIYQLFTFDYPIPHVVLAG